MSHGWLRVGIAAIVLLGMVPGGTQIAQANGRALVPYKAKVPARVEAPKSRTRTHEARERDRRSFLGRHLRVRPEVRRSAKNARRDAREGKMDGARSGLEQTRQRTDLGLRERLTLWNAERSVKRAPRRQERDHQLHRFRRGLRAAELRAQRGELQRAVDHLERARGTSPNMLNRRKLNQLERSVRRSAFRQVRRRARRGDVEGTVDALGALEGLRDQKRLGWWNRRSVNKADGKALTRNLKLLKRLLREQQDPDGNPIPPDPQRALQHLQSVASIWGADHPQVQKAVRTLFDGAMHMADKAAKAGDAQQAEMALETARQVMSDRRARTRFERERTRILKKAAKAAIPRLIRMAQTQQRMGNSGEAAQSLHYAEHLQRETGVKPGWRSRRIRNRLQVELGPLLTQLRRQARRDGRPTPPPRFRDPLDVMTATANAAR